MAAARQGWITRTVTAWSNADRASARRCGRLSAAHWRTSRHSAAAVASEGWLDQAVTAMLAAAPSLDSSIDVCRAHAAVARRSNAAPCTGAARNRSAKVPAGSLAWRTAMTRAAAWRSASVSNSAVSAAGWVGGIPARTRSASIAATTSALANTASARPRTSASQARPAAHRCARTFAAASGGRVDASTCSARRNTSRMGPAASAAPGRNAASRRQPGARHGQGTQGGFLHVVHGPQGGKRGVGRGAQDGERIGQQAEPGRGAVDRAGFHVHLRPASV